MEKFNLSEKLKQKSSLIVKDSQGRHIGCSGAICNTLEYYNPGSLLNRTSSNFPDIAESNEKSFASREDSEVVSYGQEKVLHMYDIRNRPAICEKDLSTCRIQTCDSDEGKNNTVQQRPSSYEEPENNISSDTKQAQDESNLKDNCKSSTGQTADNHMKEFTRNDNLSRPQTEDSYYARIDEAFRRGRPGSPRIAWEEVRDGNKGDGNKGGECPRTNLTSKTRKNNNQAHRSKRCTLL